MSRLEIILRAYFLSEEFKNLLNQENFKSKDRIKLICKSDKGNLLGIITEDRMIKYEYILDDIKTTIYEIKTYTKYSKDYIVESSHHKDNDINNEWIRELVEEWRAENNIDMISDYSIFDNVLKELKKHRKYILGIE